MGYSVFALNEWLLLVAIVIVLLSIVIFACSRGYRNAVLDRLQTPRRRTTGASTPPPLFSSREDSVDIKELLPPSVSSFDYVKTFPPSRRSALLELITTSPSEKGKLIRPELTLEGLQRDTLSSKNLYRFEKGASKYTPTGFSIAEIKDMGDFPAYDVLSGVPLPRPYKGFDAKSALPRPYRPLRWAYHQTMALTKMEPDWWLEIENTYISRIEERKQLFRKYGSDVLQCLPRSELACKELMEMCLQFYCARYPAYFSLSEDKKTFYNDILNEESDITIMSPLHVILNNIPEDFAVMLRNEEDGMYYFRAGVICSSLGWNVGTKIGLQLKDIHKPIPFYKEKMSFSMDRYFSKMPTNSPIQRGSWGLEIGKPLFMPVGDPHERYRGVQEEDLTIDECFFRVDWQTLRRLPLSGAIIFNFKTLFTPVKEFRDESYIPALLLKIIKEANRPMMEYKNTWHVEHVCIPELEKYAQEQVAKGLVQHTQGEETWHVSTLEESPYFPGWKEKWHRQQGF